MRLPKLSITKVVHELQRSAKPKGWAMLSFQQLAVAQNEVCRVCPGGQSKVDAELIADIWIYAHKGVKIQGQL